MRPVIRDSTEWKLRRFAEVEFSQLPDRERPVNQLVRLLINKWENRYPLQNEELDTELTGWKHEAMVLEGEEYRYGRTDTDEDPVVPPQFEEEKRRVEIDDSHREELGEIVEEEFPGVVVEDMSFDELLEAVLNAWNEYAIRVQTGWRK